jgi:hypothetical protein
MTADSQHAFPPSRMSCGMKVKDSIVTCSGNTGLTVVIALRSRSAETPLLKPHNMPQYGIGIRIWRP